MAAAFAALATLLYPMMTRAGHNPARSAGLIAAGDLYPPWDPDIPFEERKYAPALAEKLRLTIARAELPVLGPHGRVSVTVSIGVSLYDPQTHPGATDMLDDAEIAMRFAKRTGGNRIEVERIVSALGCHWFALKGVSTVHCELAHPVRTACAHTHGQLNARAQLTH